MRVTGNDESETNPKFPKIHFVGEMGDSSTMNGTVELTEDDQIRWHFVSSTLPVCGVTDLTTTNRFRVTKDRLYGGLLTNMIKENPAESVQALRVSRSVALDPRTELLVPGLRCSTTAMTLLVRRAEHGTGVHYLRNNAGPFWLRKTFTIEDE